MHVKLRLFNFRISGTKRVLLLLVARDTARSDLIAARHVHTLGQ